MRDPRPGIGWSQRRLQRRAGYAAWMSSPDWLARRRAWHEQWTRRYGTEPTCQICGKPVRCRIGESLLARPPSQPGVVHPPAGLVRAVDSPIRPEPACRRSGKPVRCIGNCSYQTRRYGNEPTCQICGKPWSLRDGALHHRSYQRLGHEADSDLVPLCREPCHLLLHRILESNPAWLKAGRPYATDTIIAHLRARRKQGETNP